MKFTIGRIIIGTLAGLSLFLVAAYDKAYSDFKAQEVQIGDIKVVALSNVWKNIKNTAIQVGEDQCTSNSGATGVFKSDETVRVVVRGTIRDEGWKRYLDSIEAPTDVKDWLVRIIQCESRGDPLAENSQHVIVNGVDYGTAKGLLQIIDEAWVRFGCEGSVWNEYNAVDCGVHAFKMGRQSEWSCK